MLTNMFRELNDSTSSSSTVVHGNYLDIKPIATQALLLKGPVSLTICSRIDSYWIC